LSLIVGVHLDLKGVMFKPRYHRQFLTDLSRTGVNAIVVEYEDIFPFKGLDIAWDPSVSWPARTLKSFLKTAAELRIEVIPLQQCLGHLEYLLRWDAHRDLAEDRDYPSTLRLGNKKAKALVADMLRQMIEAHPDSRYVHLGMDEARGLLGAARRLDRHVLDLFLTYLDELCTITEAYGKTPIIWSDMLEDHFEPGMLDGFQDRVILAPWEYTRHGQTDHLVRLAGRRASRQWLERADDPNAPSMSQAIEFIEDLPKSVMKRVKPYMKDRGFVPLFQADMWRDMGFGVIGACALRSAAHLAVMPDYNHLFNNINTWAEASRRAGLLGVIGSGWARGTTFCPPAFNLDLIWPCAEQFGRAMGRKVRPFWTGVPNKTVKRITAWLGRSKHDWQMEMPVIQEMRALRPRVKQHVYEWDSLLLMAETMNLQRRADATLAEVDYFHADCRLVVAEWKRRITDQRSIIHEIDSLRDRILRHFSKRYHGTAFEEWVRDLFGLREDRLKECTRICRRKKAVAAERYRAK
jgi:hypothetical protein